MLCFVEIQGCFGTDKRLKNPFHEHFGRIYKASVLHENA